MRTLTVGVIGTGRVGGALGAALRAAGHDVHTGAPAGADLVLLTVPDGAIAEQARRLATGSPETNGSPETSGPSGIGAVAAGTVVAHTSGAYGLAVLEPVTAAGARPLALHPAMTFTGEATDLERLPGISYGVTAPDDLRPFATRLVADLGGTVEWVPEAARPLYHAALAHAANHLVTLLGEAGDQLRQAGVREPARLLAPLVRAALENALARGDAALTGPVARADSGTIRAHLRALHLASPDSVPSYRALAQRTADRAVAAGRLTPAQAEAVRDALAPEPLEVPA